MVDFEFFRSTGATPCTDWIKFGQRQSSPIAAGVVMWVPENCKYYEIWNERHAGVYPLYNSYIFKVCGPRPTLYDFRFKFGGIRARGSKFMGSNLA